MDMPLWFSNLVFWSVQVAFLVLAAGLLARVLKLHQPRVLLAFWRSLLAIGLLLPLIQPWHRPPRIAASVISADFALPLLPVSSPAATRWHLPSLQTIAPILGIAILAGIALRLGILALGLLKLRRLRRASRPIADTAVSAATLQTVRNLVAAPAEFRLSSQVDSPVTFGFVAPVVLLPERFSSLEPRFQSAIACHELLHVRRRDWAHHLVEEVFRALFWFHPAIAWLISRVRLAREQVVDLEVVRLTNARKSYLEALLEFTNARTGLAAIPAPPFLAERQLVERVSLMLKEVRMSQRRLIASLIAISSCLVLVGVLAAWTFPLKAQGVVGGVIGGVPGGITQGISGGVVGGVSKGVVEGVISGIPGGINTHASDEEPSVDKSTIWVDTVKKGTMPVQVRGTGPLVRGEGSTNLVARVTIPASMAADVKPDQSAVVAANGTSWEGHVRSVGPGETTDTRTVDIALDSEPQRSRMDLRTPGRGFEVMANITIGKLDNVLYIGRPASVPANSEPNVSAALYKIDPDGKGAERVIVKIGRASANTIEVVAGLKEGDKVILSDMSAVDSAERIRLTQDASQPQTAHQEKPASYPTCRYCPNPDYPDEARQAKISSAKVVLQVSVLESGDVDPQDIRVLKDPGNGFADKAISAVKKWKMKPATLSDGTPVKISVPVEVSFRMKTK